MARKLGEYSSDLEITTIMDDFNKPGSLAPIGLYLGGTKYMVIQGESGVVIRGKKIYQSNINLEFFFLLDFVLLSYPQSSSQPQTSWIIAHKKLYLQARSISPKLNTMDTITFMKITVAMEFTKISYLTITEQLLSGYTIKCDLGFLTSRAEPN
ncbi:hypothetical protein JHK82_043701 [Glycine max]|nr:hypothetical protein JHK86_043579 [Glycine max]KAG4957869.1 hypothetical protein JHK85_044249 [Glycine max]KAG5106731.1 hypothetical protein JHK82_043701 [Glycine max]